MHLRQAGEHASWVVPGEWHSVVETLGLWAFGLALGAALTLGWLHRRRYATDDVLSDHDREVVHEALRAAERRTIGEIVPVVLERSDRHPAARWIAALAGLLLGSGTLVGVLPWGAPLQLLLCQLALGALGFALAAWLPPVRRCFIVESRATEVAEEQAVQEFFGLGLRETEGRTGVLLMVSLLERRVIVLADQGISERVEPTAWQEARDAVLSGIRRGSLRDGLIDGITKIADVLAEHAPWQAGDRNELPDRLIVRRD
ncbi:MAG: hypothetical protein AAF628_12925 [Planctomycetota bacterium]